MKTINSNWLNVNSKLSKMNFNWLFIIKIEKNTNLTNGLKKS